MIYQRLTDLIGQTPILQLNRYARQNRVPAQLLAKLECFNPLSSAKDRVGCAMIEDAERRGVLLPGGTVIEPTSGNTGVGLAFTCASRGYRLILTMPETMSKERRMLLSALGAELVLTPGSQGMAGSIQKAQELLKSIPGAFMPMQFENPANPQIHYETTAQEILADVAGNLAVLVCGVGTGGTITGVGRRLKEALPNLHIVAVEPAGSPVLSGGKPGPHGLQGIGAGFVPKALDTSVYDEVIPVKEEDAFNACRCLARQEGLLCGITSGAALHAAALVAQRKAFKGKRILCVFPDSG
ncbi:MAG: cysteine synthase A, partial [Clostridia bacterium]|nr:cysteine synthase A [Clostridia bacterium]